MKNSLYLLLLLLAFVPATFAQSKSSSKITAKPAGLGRVTISKGGIRRVIDLKKDIAGCAYVAAEFKKSLDRKGCSASPATITLSDARTKDKVNYVLLSVVAMGGCNVCGRCGAGESTTLIWLALNAALKETARRSVVVEDCSENIEILNESMVPVSEDVYDLTFDGDIFKVEFEKTIYGDDDESGYEFGTAEYDRSKPELGLVIRTEKRKESSAKYK